MKMMYQMDGMLVFVNVVILFDAICQGKWMKVKGIRLMISLDFWLCTAQEMDEKLKEDVSGNFQYKWGIFVTVVNYNSP